MNVGEKRAILVCFIILVINLFCKGLSRISPLVNIINNIWFSLVVHQAPVCFDVFWPGLLELKKIIKKSREKKEIFPTFFTENLRVLCLIYNLKCRIDFFKGILGDDRTHNIRKFSMFFQQPLTNKNENVLPVKFCRKFWVGNIGHPKKSRKNFKFKFYMFL